MTHVESISATNPGSFDTDRNNCTPQHHIEWIVLSVISINNAVAISFAYIEMKNLLILLSALLLVSVKAFFPRSLRDSMPLPHLQKHTVLPASPSSSQDRIPIINMFVNVAAAILSVPSCALQPFGPPMMEPPPQSKKAAQRRLLVDDLLDLAYSDKDDEMSAGYDVFALPIAEETRFAQFSSSSRLGSSGGPSTYGEVTTLGARQLFYFMGMIDVESSTSTTTTTDKIVFYDLGMGRGKVVVQALLELERVDKSIGVELSHMRQQAAVLAWQTLTSQHAALHSTSQHRLGLYQGDLFDQDLTNATHIYIASLCFTDTMMQDLQLKLKALPKLKCVASLKKFPTWAHSRSEYVEMTWTRPHGCVTYFYDL